MNLKLGANNDIIIDRGTVVTSGLDYTAQLVGNRLRTLRGEWELNTTIGLPWFTDLLRKNYDANLIYGWVQSTILTTPNVTGISNLILGASSKSRILLITFEARTTYGNLISSVEV